MGHEYTDDGVWCEYELLRLPREEFDMTAEYGLVHARSALGAPLHSTTGLEVPTAELVAFAPAAAAQLPRNGTWDVPLIEPVVDG